MSVRVDVDVQHREPGTVPEVRNKELEDEEVKENSGIKIVKLKDIRHPRHCGPKGYTKAICELKVGGDGVFLPTSAASALGMGYRAAAIVSGIRYSVRKVDGGSIVTREA